MTQERAVLAGGCFWGMQDLLRRCPGVISAESATRVGTYRTRPTAIMAEDAVVRDEGKTIKGLAAIKRWKAETKKKYQHTVEPLASARKDGKIIVTNRLTGNFPGSPIDLQFILVLDGDKIASLEIRS